MHLLTHDASSLLYCKFFNTNNKTNKEKHIKRFLLILGEKIGFSISSTEYYYNKTVIFQQQKINEMFIFVLAKPFDKHNIKNLLAVKNTLDMLLLSNFESLQL